jgi:hypothetical protein
VTPVSGPLPARLAGANAWIASRKTSHYRPTLIFFLRFRRRWRRNRRKKKQWRNIALSLAFQTWLPARRAARGVRCIPPVSLTSSKSALPLRNDLLKVQNAPHQSERLGPSNRKPVLGWQGSETQVKQGFDRQSNREVSSQSGAGQLTAPDCSRLTECLVDFADHKRIALFRKSDLKQFPARRRPDLAQGPRRGATHHRIRVVQAARQCRNC